MSVTADRLGRPLVLRKAGGSLVGVGRTLSVLMPPSDPPAGSPFRSEQPIVDVSADDATLSHLTIATWDHLPAYAMHWRGSGGTWRQSFFNRLTEATFPPFSAPGALAKGPPLVLRKGTPYARPLSVISGGGAFYDFNLDFGCCFGTVVAPANTAPDTSSSGEVLLQQPSYRTVLVNGSSAGVGSAHTIVAGIWAATLRACHSDLVADRFYPLNAEQDFGEAHTEIRYSSNVTIFGAKSENNYVRPRRAATPAC